MINRFIEQQNKLIIAKCYMQRNYTARSFQISKSVENSSKTICF